MKKAALSFQVMNACSNDLCAAEVNSTASADIAGKQSAFFYENLVSSSLSERVIM